MISGVLAGHFVCPIIVAEQTASDSACTDPLIFFCGLDRFQTSSRHRDLIGGKRPAFGVPSYGLETCFLVIAMMSAQLVSD
jgi:hypothetical protein